MNDHARKLVTRICTTIFWILITIIIVASALTLMVVLLAIAFGLDLS